MPYTPTHHVVLSTTSESHQDPSPIHISQHCLAFPAACDQILQLPAFFCAAEHFGLASKKKKKGNTKGSKPTPRRCIIQPSAPHTIPRAVWRVPAMHSVLFFSFFSLIIHSFFSPHHFHFLFLPGFFPLSIGFLYPGVAYQTEHQLEGLPST